MIVALISFLLSACGSVAETATSTPEQYGGTASLSQGKAAVSTENIYPCDRGRKAPLGKSTATDGSTWIVPAENNFNNNGFPFASDLFNPCTGVQYNSAAEAVAALDGTDIVEINEDGELVTAYIFADNYFELYINGVATGKDNVPFTQFNSNLVRFKVNTPFTIAMKLVDWEENSGIGSESNRGTPYHPGDGGMVAVFKNTNGETIAKTDQNWKAQTFYTAPIRDLSCPSEVGSLRLTSDCSTEGPDDGSADYALHWQVPADWSTENFDDASWPNATTYTNKTIGVDNKPAYTNFIDIFDDSSDDAQFIWSTNVVLDNEVIVRFRVE